MPKRKTYTPNPDFSRQTRGTTLAMSVVNGDADNNGGAAENNGRANEGLNNIEAAGSLGGADNLAENQGIQGQGRPFNSLKFDSNICEKYNPKTMDAHTWLHKFLSIATWAKWTNEQMCFYFGLHLLEDAYNWYANLPTAIATNFNELKEQFTIRFSLHGSSKWSIMPEIYEMKQRHDQPVQDFIQKVQMKAKVIDLPEDQIIGALMKGFLPHIRADLIRSNINTLHEVMKEAAISEAANKIKSSQSENILSEERLIKAIQAAMSISNLQPTESNTETSLSANRPKQNTYHNTYHKQNTYSRQRSSQAPSRMRSSVNQNYICSRCSRRGQHYQDQCPFIDSVCFDCSKTGHIRRACKAKRE